MSSNSEKRRKRFEAEHNFNKITERRRINQISLVILAALLVVFGVAIFNVMRIEKARREELNQIAEANANENIKNKEEGRLLHETIASAIASDIGSVVCLGDSFMGKSFPESLEDILQEEVLGNINEVIFTKANVYGLGQLRIPVFDEVTVNEELNGILARNKVIPIKVAQSIVIPGNVENVGISLVDGDNRPLYFKSEINLTINGVEGVVSDVQGEGLVFTRKSEGDVVSVEAGTEAYPDSIDSFKGAMLVLVFGESYSGRADEIIDAEKSLINAYQSDRHLVVGITENGSELDQEMASAFGDNYLRVEKSSYDSYETAKQVFSLLDERGYFSSVKNKAKDGIAELNAMK